MLSHDKRVTAVFVSVNQALEMGESEAILLSVLSSKLRENKKTAELIKTANLLFNSFEPYYMWDYIARWFEECCRFATLMLKY